MIIENPEPIEIHWCSTLLDQMLQYRGSSRAHGVNSTYWPTSFSPTIRQRSIFTSDRNGSPFGFNDEPHDLHFSVQAKFSHPPNANFLRGNSHACADPRQISSLCHLLFTQFIDSVGVN